MGEIYQSANIESGEEPIKVTEKCPECNGTGIVEKEAGLISWTCPICNGTGAVPSTEVEIAGTEGVGEPSRPLGTEYSDIPGPVLGASGKYTGLLFQLGGKQEGEFLQYTTEELWTFAKKSTESETLWPYIVKMPCGNTQRFDDFKNLPTEDIPCPCGNPNHYIVKFEDVREVADAKPNNDGDDLQRGTSGDRLDSPATGSGVTRKPKKPQKSKASKKTRKARQKLLPKA